MYMYVQCRIGPDGTFVHGVIHSLSIGGMAVCGSRMVLPLRFMLELLFSSLRGFGGLDSLPESSAQ